MPRRREIRELLAPLPLAAAGLVFFSSLVLQPAFPNPVTAKLSMVAGGFFLPLFVSALLGLTTREPLPTRIAVGAAFTAVLFISIAISPTAAREVCGLLDTVCGPFGRQRHLVADPTDLVALPSVALAVGYGLRRGRRLAR